MQLDRPLENFFLQIVRIVFEQFLGAPNFRGVVKHEDDANDLAVLAVDRRRAIFDRPFRAILRDKQRMISESDDPVFAENFFDGIIGGVARLFVDDSKNRAERFLFRVLPFPTGESFCFWIDEGNFAVPIGHDHSVADARQRHAKPLFLFVEFGQRFLVAVGKKSQLAPRPHARDEKDRGGDSVTENVDESAG